MQKLFSSPNGGEDETESKVAILALKQHFTDYQTHFE
jgi:hypothetical protein